jgi:hypothetical protein
MVGAMSKHVMSNHPNVAKQMGQMHKEEPKSDLEKQSQSGMLHLKIDSVVISRSCATEKSTAQD